MNIRYTYLLAVNKSVLYISGSVHLSTFFFGKFLSCRISGLKYVPTCFFFKPSIPATHILLELFCQNVGAISNKIILIAIFM
jgi:hypothetical protein